jgi:hypothetical protein
MTHSLLLSSASPLVAVEGPGESRVATASPLAALAAASSPKISSRKNDLPLI